jgi:anti-anti-sigma regulatory factor
LPVTVERQETHWRIRLEGELAMASMAELQSALLEGLASKKELHLDMTRTDEIDLAALQLLWAAGRAAGRAGTKILARISDAVAATAQDAGFERFPVPVE